MSDATTAEAAPLSSRLIQLFTMYPCAGSDKSDFRLTLPSELSDRAYETVVKHISFRRKCMNQGFDNLLELLAIHKEAFDRTTQAAEEMSPDDMAPGTKKVDPEVHP